MGDTELHLEHNHDLENRNQRSNKNFLGAWVFFLGIFALDIYLNQSNLK